MLLPYQRDQQYEGPISHSSNPPEQWIGHSTGDLRGVRVVTARGGLISDLLVYDE